MACNCPKCQGKEPTPVAPVSQEIENRIREAFKSFSGLCQEFDVPVVCMALVPCADDTATGLGAIMVGPQHDKLFEDCGAIGAAMRLASDVLAKGNAMQKDLERITARAKHTQN